MPEEMVTVYSFRTRSGHAEIPVVAPYKATLESIKAAGGELVGGTEEVVPLGEVDEHGHYRGRAGGRGEPG